MNLQFSIKRFFLSLCLLAASLFHAQAQAQTIPRESLAEALQEGGFIILMRHASSPRQTPDAASANPDNVNRERQLDAQGRQEAQAMGAALARLNIQISEVLSSPTYRAHETAREMGFDSARDQPELGNDNFRETGESRTAWLQQAMAQEVSQGNRLLITHAPNVNAAFPEHADGMGEGEALIFDPRGMEGPVMIQRIAIEDWPAL